MDQLSSLAENGTVLPIKPDGKHLSPYPIPGYDPYPKFNDLATRWAEKYQDNRVPLFGRLIERPTYDPATLVDLQKIFSSFGEDSNTVQRIVLSDDDRNKYLLLKSATAWSKNVVLPSGRFLLIFYSDASASAIPQMDEHESLHLVVDRVTQLLKAPQVGLDKDDGDHNPVLYKGFAQIRRFEDWLRVGAVMLMEHKPVKMTRDELAALIEQYKPSSVEDFLSLQKSLLASPESKANPVGALGVRLYKEFCQAFTARYFEKFAKGVGILQLPGVLNAIDAKEQLEFFNDYLGGDARRFLVD